MASNHIDLTGDDDIVGGATQHQVSSPTRVLKLVSGVTSEAGFCSERLTCLPSFTT